MNYSYIVQIDYSKVALCVSSFRKISFWSKSLISGFRQNSPQPKHFAVVVPQLAMAGVHLVGQMISLGFQLKNDLLKIKVNITKNIVPTLVLQSKGYTYLTHNQSNIILWSKILIRTIKMYSLFKRLCLDSKTTNETHTCLSKELLPLLHFNILKDWTHYKWYLL